jgi:hypothetical protein
MTDQIFEIRHPYLARLVTFAKGRVVLKCAKGGQYELSLYQVAELRKRITAESIEEAFEVMECWARWIFTNQSHL